MGCCCADKTEPEEEEDDLTGPLEDRSCTDILFLLFFAAFLVGMIVLFGMGVSRGNPYRIIHGTDVAGNICGRDNKEIKDVTYSGKNLKEHKYLYFDILRTAKMVGDASLSSALSDSSVFDQLNFDKAQMNNREFCLVEAYTEEKTETTAASADNQNNDTQALHDDDAGVIKLNDDTFEDFDNSEVSNKEVTGIILSSKMLKNESQVLVLLENGGELRVWRTEKASSSSDSATELLSQDPVNKIMEGGGSCRYCVKECPANHKNFLSRCVPEAITTQAGGLFSSTGADEFAEELVGDFQNCAMELLYMALVALGLSLVMTMLFRFLAGVIVYVIIAVVVIACIAGTITLWIVWYLKKTDLENYTELQGQTSEQNVTVSFTGTKLHEEAKAEVNYWAIGAIIATFVLIAVLLVLLVMRKRIALVVTLFKEAGKAVHAMPLLVLLPLLTFISIASITFFWLYGSLWIFTSGDPAQDTDTGYITYKPDQFMTWMRWYHIFGLLWLTQFCVACQHLVIAGSVAGWYFSKDKGSVGVGTVLSAFYRLVRYHLGTAAFGSFIIALIQLVRLILKYLESKVEDWEKKGCSGPMVIVLKGLLKCAQCCLWCFEKCMKYINVNAYIETAIYGYNFCRAAMKAFQILTANALRVAAINSVGTFVLFLGKITVVIGTFFISLKIMQAKTSGDNGVYVAHPWAPVLISTLFSYISAHCFIAVYGMAIDTIFLCFCEDSARNDGINKPYFMSKGLMEFVENSKKALEAAERRNVKESESKQFLVEEKRPTSASSMEMLPSVD